MEKLVASRKSTCDGCLRRKSSHSSRKPSAHAPRIPVIPLEAQLYTAFFGSSPWPRSTCGPSSADALIPKTQPLFPGRQARRDGIGGVDQGPPEPVQTFQQPTNLLCGNSEHRYRWLTTDIETFETRRLRHDTPKSGIASLFAEVRQVVEGAGKTLGSVNHGIALTPPNL